MTTASPFLLSANHLVRPCDAHFGAVMASDQAFARMIGPRRTGKTTLVANYCRENNAPAVTVTLHPTLRTTPGILIENGLANALAGLAHTRPKLWAEYRRLSPADSKRKLTLNAAVPIPGMDPLSIGGGASYEVEPRKPDHFPEDETAALGNLGTMLHNLGLAARKTGCRPVIFFDEIQEAIVRDKALGMSAVWAIRNEAQHHKSCRFVFAGSNQRLFNTISSADAPLLNFGTTISIPPLTIEQVDQWAIPLFRAQRIHVRTFAPLCRLLCGKIGELTDVLTQLWLSAKPDDVLDDGAQIAALRATALDKSLPEIDDTLRSLTPAQAKLLGWMLGNPQLSPYTRAAVASHGLPVGTARTAAIALGAKGLLEDFNGETFVSSPLRIWNALSR
jgi:hypothetical protein